LSDENIAVGKSLTSVAATAAIAAVSPAAALIYVGVKFVSGLVGNAIDEKVEAAKRDGREQGRNQAKAEYAHIFEKARAQADERKRHAREQDRYDDLTMTLFSVGVAVLAQCGAVTADNVAGIKEFAFGSAHGSLPATVASDCVGPERGHELMSVWAQLRAA
jgi:hypothetical protein